MTNRRMAEAALDARDCLTRAAALYAQHWADAAYPTQSGERIKAPGKPESQAPSSGDTAARTGLNQTISNVSRCVTVLAGLGVVERLGWPLPANAPPAAVIAYVDYADKVFAWAAYADGLEANTVRRIHHAAKFARAALAAWDTPDRDAIATYGGSAKPGTWAYAFASRAARREHGTAVTPPAHYPTGSRCATCGWAEAEQGRKDCDACRQRRQRQRNAEVEKARRRHRSDVRWDGVTGPHTSADFEQCACDPRRQRRRINRKKAS